MCIRDSHGAILDDLGDGVVLGGADQLGGDQLAVPLGVLVGLDDGAGNALLHHLFRSLGPVSYTHLDVYKRQMVCSTPKKNLLEV